MAVRLAIGEAKVIQENKEYFQSEGVNLSVVESHFSGQKSAKRSTTTLLVKNLPHDTNEIELESMFARFGSIDRFLIPPSKALALVDFVEPSEARQAFSGLAYRKYKHVPLYVEWAPLDTITDKTRTSKSSSGSSSSSSGSSGKCSKQVPDNSNVESTEDVDDESLFGSLFIKNLSFSTTEEGLRAHLQMLGCHSKSIRAVSIPKKRKGDQLLSMGFGFVELRSVIEMLECLKRVDGTVLDRYLLTKSFPQIICDRTLLWIMTSCFRFLILLINF